MSIIRYGTNRGILDTLQNELTTLLGDNDLTYTRWSPHVDIQSKSDQYIVYVDIPGVDPKDINIHIDGNLLTIEGERKNKSEDKKQDEEGYIRTERFFGKFSRSFTFPDDNIMSESVKATCNKGILELTIPKLEKKKPRKIYIKESD